MGPTDSRSWRASDKDLEAFLNSSVASQFSQPQQPGMPGADLARHRLPRCVFQILDVLAEFMQQTELVSSSSKRRSLANTMHGKLQGPFREGLTVPWAWEHD